MTETAPHTDSGVVAQAVGMVSVQADCSSDEATRLIRQHARSLAKTIDQVAASVVDRSVRIEPVR